VVVISEISIVRASYVGNGVGNRVGSVEGSRVGSVDGSFVGIDVGDCDGRNDGDRVGDNVLGEDVCEGVVVGDGDGEHSVFAEVAQCESH